MKLKFVSLTNLSIFSFCLFINSVENITRMDISQFSILGESLIADGSEMMTSQTSSQPFSPNVSDSEGIEIWQRSVSQQTDEKICNLEKLDALKCNCKCACHLFRNGQVSEETPCQGKCKLCHKMTQLNYFNSNMRCC